MITIDGSSGEGGGQILRTSLALSLVTGKPFRMERIRAGRPKPGLQRQHLTAVRAAAEVGRADVEGALLGSRELRFAPRGVEPGDYHFAVGTAGSVTLVLQTVLPALLVASAPSRLLLEGGTHNIFAPPFDFLAKSFLPLVERMGPRMEAVLERAGFYPSGGGAMRVAIHPEPKLRPIELLERGRVTRRLARAIVSRLPRHIAEREVETVRRGLSWPADSVAVEEVPSPGPGNVLLVEVESEQLTEVFSGFGQRGVSAEKVAHGVVREVRRYLEAGVPVGEHLADQLLLPLAVAGGGSFRTLAPSSHMTTNLQTLQHFLDVRVTCEEIAADDWHVAVAG